MPAVPSPAPGGPSERGVSANSDPDPRAGVASVSRLQRQPQRCRTEGVKEHSHKVRPVPVQDRAEGQAVAERSGHVGDAHIPVALALLPAPLLQGLDGRHACGGPGGRLEELATGPARAREADEAQTRRPPSPVGREHDRRPTLKAPARPPAPAP